MFEQTTLHPLSSNGQQAPFVPGTEMSCYLQVGTIEVAAAALLRLWQEHDLNVSKKIMRIDCTQRMSISIL